jgi:hypothetical protein
MFQFWGVILNSNAVKKNIFTGLLNLLTLAVDAQYDDKFYFPSKKIQKIDSLNYEN